MSEPVTLDLIFSTIAVISVLTALAIVIVRFKKPKG